jgi:hypothetical protein
VNKEKQKKRISHEKKFCQQRLEIARGLINKEKQHHRIEQELRRMKNRE